MVGLTLGILVELRRIWAEGWGWLGKMLAQSRWCGWQWSDDKNTWVRQKWDDDQDTDGERENMRAGAPTGHRQPPSIGWTARRRS